MVQFLVEHGAGIYATTIRDNETAAEKCEEEEENYLSCTQYLLRKARRVSFLFLFFFVVVSKIFKTIWAW